MQGRINEATAEQFARIIEQYSQDNVFWTFAASFAATIGYDLESGDPERTARLFAECERQYSYLRGEHYEYFKKLHAQVEPTNRVYAVVAAVAIAANLPALHFAKDGFLGSTFRTAKAEHIAAHAKAGALSKRPNTPEDRREWSALAPTDAFAVPTGGLSTDELVALAQEFYAQSKGRLIKVYDYVLEGSGVPAPQRTCKVFRDYDIAVVAGDGEENVGAEFEGGKAVESFWPVVMLTGPNRGLRAEVVSPEFWYDGSVLENEVCLDFIPGYIIRDRISDPELVELVRLDMIDYSGMTVGVTEADAYIGETDRQETLHFDPPLPAVIEEFDGSSDRLSSKYRLDDWSQVDRVTVIDTWMDFETTDERAEGYRSFWAHGVSYTSAGEIPPGRFPLLPFIPDSVVGRRFVEEVSETAPSLAL